MSQEHADYILALDKKQLVEKRVCQKDRSHGQLGVHGSGNGLICGKCDYAERISK